MRRVTVALLTLLAAVGALTPARAEAGPPWPEADATAEAGSNQTTDPMGLSSAHASATATVEGASTFDLYAAQALPAMLGLTGTMSSNGTAAFRLPPIPSTGGVRMATVFHVSGEATVGTSAGGAGAAYLYADLGCRTPCSGSTSAYGQDLLGSSVSITAVGRSREATAGRRVEVLMEIVPHFFCGYDRVYDDVWVTLRGVASSDGASTASLKATATFDSIAVEDVPYPPCE